MLLQRMYKYINSIYKNKQNRHRLQTHQNRKHVANIESAEYCGTFSYRYLNFSNSIPFLKTLTPLPQMIFVLLYKSRVIQ